MSQQNQNSGASDDMIIMGIVAFAIAALILVGVLNANQATINAIAGAIAWVHVVPFAMLGRTLSTVPQVPALPFLPDVITVEHFLSTSRYSSMLPEQRDLVLSVAGRCASIVYAPLLVLLSLVGTKYRPDQIFTEKPTIDSMIIMQSSHWKTLQPIRLINPAKLADITASSIARAIGERRQKLLPDFPSEVLVPEATAYKAPDWARSMRPEEWLVAQGLTHDQKKWADLRETRTASDDAAMVFPERWLNVDLDGAIELLSGQLTQQWRGFASLRPYQQCLCAVFALFYDYQNSKGEVILNELAVLYAAKGGAQIDDLIVAEKNLYKRVTSALSGKPGKNLADQASQHAWLQTAMVRMLTVARKDRGVLATAQFNWLKVEDRSLWYALCNTGGDAFMIEAAGVFAHFKAETQIGMPLRRPAVYQAARALMEDYLDLRPERVEKRARRAELSKPVSDRFSERMLASQQSSAIEAEELAAEQAAAAAGEKK